MTFEPQNTLEESLIRAATDPAARPQFYRDFCESEIFIIQYGEQLKAPVGNSTLPAGYQLKIQPVEINNKNYLPVFSSLLRLQSFIADQVNYIKLNTLEFLRITQGAELLLNPGSDYGKEFCKEEILSLLDGSMWSPQKRYVVEKETSVLLGQPANYPHELVNALSSLFKHHKEVKKAYLAHFFNPATDEKAHTLIALEVTGNWDKISAEAGIVAEGIKIPDPPVDFMPITGQSTVYDYFLKNQVAPFYVKKRFGLF